VLAAYASAINADDPLAGLSVGQMPEPVPPADDWVTVTVRTSALNHHDLWSLRGVGLPSQRLPMILGCDATAVDDEGHEFVIYPVVAAAGDGKGYSILSEVYPGTLAEQVAIPRQNLIPKPAGVSFTDAACLPTAWLTAYRMLRAKGRVDEADAVLVQGAGGGVATAAVILAVAMGKRVYATSRDPGKRERIAALGAIGVEPGTRLPERVGVVIETVGAATLDHSLKAAAPGGRIVVSGATGGHLATVDVRRLFSLQLEILGSSMGTAEELAEVLDLVANGAKPAFEKLHSGNIFGKIVLDHTA
jgi:NADPH:quinone reductase-like Zn-dependent oxidoreductase